MFETHSSRQSYVIAAAHKDAIAMRETSRFLVPKTTTGYRSRTVRRTDNNATGAVMCEYDAIIEALCAWRSRFIIVP